MNPLNKPVASVSTRLLLAALFWDTAAAILAAKGISALLDSPLSSTTLFLALLSGILGLIKARFVLNRTAQKAAFRIQAKNDGCAFGFFSLKSWGLILAMMAMGRLLRMLHMPMKVIGVIYLTIAVALAVASRILWQEYGQERGEGQQ
ncbi:MAG: hypothetical protein PHC35_05925 [Deltaproteobacteria bacterium]|nr:hypothetical protein [Deltaproteobacteria bacterium]